MDELIKCKYGDLIWEKVFDSSKKQMKRLADGSPLEGHLGRKETQDIVRSLNEILEKVIAEEVIEKYEWAFDLPAWVGPFDIGKIMVIGLEPHIEKHSYQLTYNIDGIAQSDSFDDHCKNKQYLSSLTTFWKRLSMLVEKDDEKGDKWCQNKDRRTTFLEQFYITDLCHFAPKGKQNLIKEIKNWPKIKTMVAQKFLKREIEIVQPEIIIGHGSDVREQIRQIFDIKSPIETPGCVKLPDIDIPFLAITHLGSSQTSRYWKEDGSDLKKARELYEKAKSGKC